MSYRIASIVEGHGEVQAVPLLIRTHWPTLVPCTPIRVARQKVTKPDELIRAARLAEAAICDSGFPGGVLLLLDADKDCAATLASQLRGLLSAALPNRLCHCVLAVREFESWLVAGHPDAAMEPDEERATKAWLRARNRDRYQPTVDQPRFTASMDLQRAVSGSRSFRKFFEVMNEFQRDATAH
ncbi:MAG: hypothetical protein ACOYN0_13100 [Phycisphaerales bacterium]